MKISDRVEMKDSSHLGTYWGTVTDVAGYDKYMVTWDNQVDANDWIWSPSRLTVSQILESNGVIHAS